MNNAGSVLDKDLSVTPTGEAPRYIDVYYWEGATPYVIFVDRETGAATKYIAYRAHVVLEVAKPNEIFVEQDEPASAELLARAAGYADF